MKFLFIFSPHTCPLLVVLCLLRLGTLILLNTVNNYLDKKLQIVKPNYCSWPQHWFEIEIDRWMTSGKLHLCHFLSFFVWMPCSAKYFEANEANYHYQCSHKYFLKIFFKIITLAFFCIVLLKVLSMHFKIGWHQRLLINVQLLNVISKTGILSIFSHLQSEDISRLKESHWNTYWEMYFHNEYETKKKKKRD